MSISILGSMVKSGSSSSSREFARGNKYINIPYMKLLVVANGITYYIINENILKKYLGKKVVIMDKCKRSNHTSEWLMMIMISFIWSHTHARTTTTSCKRKNNCNQLALPRTLNHLKSQMLKVVLYVGCDSVDCSAVLVYLTFFSININYSTFAILLGESTLSVI